MFTFLVHNILRLIALSTLFFVPALAQFEIAPDHFDSGKKNIPRNVAKTKAKTAQPATVPGVVGTSASSGAATIRDQDKAGPQAAQRVQPKGNMQRDVSGNQAAAARQKHSEKARTVATLP